MQRTTKQVTSPASQPLETSTYVTSSSENPSSRLFHHLLTKHSKKKSPCQDCDSIIVGVSCVGVALTGVSAVLNNNVRALGDLLLTPPKTPTKLLSSPLSSNPSDIKDPIGDIQTISTDSTSALTDEKKAPILSFPPVDSVAVTPILLNLCGIENTGFSTFLTFLHTLHNTLTAFKPAFKNPLAFVLSDLQHSVTLGWNPQTQEWTLIDMLSLDHFDTPVEIFAFNQEASVETKEATSAINDSERELGFKLSEGTIEEPEASDELDELTATPVEELANKLRFVFLERRGKQTNTTFFTTTLHVQPSDLEPATRYMETRAKEQKITIQEANHQQVSTELTLLHLAAEYNLLAVAKQILSVLQDKAISAIQSGDAEGYTPLHRAAKQGHTDIINLLLDAGDLSADSRDYGAGTPLFQAARHGNEQAVKQLIERGAQVKQAALNVMSYYKPEQASQTLQTLNVLLEHNKSFSLEDDDELLYTAVNKSYAGVIHSLLLHKANFEAPLCRAAADGNHETLKLLLKFKANPNARVHGMSALYLAAQYNHNAIIELLIANKATLHCAVKESDVNTVKLLLGRKETQINSSNEMKETALHIAAANGCESIVELLLKANATPNVPNSTLETPLCMAAKNGHAAVVKQFIEHPATLSSMHPADLSMPLAIAMQAGHTEIVKQLLHVKASVGGETAASALVIAAEKGQVEMVELLLNLKVSATSNAGSSALLIAAENGYAEIMRQLLEAKALIQVVSPQSGKDALLIATKKGDAQMVKHLLDAKATVACHTGPRALLIAAANNHTQIVRQLLESNVSPHEQSVNGENALLLAIYHNNFTMVEDLLCHDADASIHSPTGKSALFLAMDKHHMDIANQLIKMNQGKVITGQQKDTPPTSRVRPQHAIIRQLLLADMITAFEQQTADTLQSENKKNYYDKIIHGSVKACRKPGFEAKTPMSKEFMRFLKQTSEQAPANPTHRVKKRKAIETTPADKKPAATPSLDKTHLPRKVLRRS